MNAGLAQLNLVAAWVGCVVGFLSGAVLGLGFHQERWLGGYASPRRRLYRLGHISFFGLALINWMFHGTVQAMQLTGPAMTWASNGFLIGAATMPVCCVVMAHWPKARPVFVVPVGSLLVAGGLTAWEVWIQYWRA